jgi:hypothetical protein
MPLLQKQYSNFLYTLFLTLMFDFGGEEGEVKEDVINLPAAVLWN